MKLSSYFYAGAVAVAALNVSAHDYETKRADSHAPIAVMGDHTHKTGEIMLSYRYMQMNMSGLATGEDSLSTSELFSQGYSVYAADMDMQMHM
ncbi:MAG: transporter, partial [Gammaproteobacteria bacterium]|nr:transporter [Gammaproteobacteria bacterium]